MLLNYGLHMPASAIITTHTINANGIDFTYMQCGSGPLALCLHGFPDSAHTWRHLMPELAQAGFRAVAPFMRGFAPTSIASNGAYQTAALAVDANALHQALGADEHAVIIGHDWGAPATYGAALLAPERWRRIVGMSVPPWGAMGNAFIGNLAQVQRSWYMFFFQHGLSDFVVGANALAFIDMLWQQWSPGFSSAVDVDNAKACLTDPAHLAAALGYYRATLGAGYRDPELDAAQAVVQGEIPLPPLLYLHGSNDGCIGVEVARDAQTRAPANAKVTIVEGAGHFMQLEQPAIVNELIVNWVKGSDR
jgi:pimeloyl-ACP methyl ester carboxylesterase